MFVKVIDCNVFFDSVSSPEVRSAFYNVKKGCIRRARCAKQLKPGFFYAFCRNRRTVAEKRIFAKRKSPPLAVARNFIGNGNRILRFKRNGVIGKKSLEKPGKNLRFGIV